MKKIKHHLKLLVLINLIIGFNISLASYVHLPISNATDFLVYFLHFIVLQITVFGFTYLITLHKVLFYTVFPISYLLLSSVSFWVFTQDISLTPSVIQAIFETKPDIAVDTISTPFILHFLWSVFCLRVSIKLFQKIKTSSLKPILLLIAAGCIALYFLGEKVKFGVFKRRLPYSPVKAVYDYKKKPSRVFNYNIPKLTKKTDSLQVIFVLGETVRADHLQINGYNRNTTPLLQKTENLVSFSNIYTPLTYTAISVPQILTNESINNENDKKSTILFSVLNNASVETNWIGNQSLETSYEAIVNSNSNVLLIDKFRSVLSFKKAKDEKLLETFDTLSFSNSTNFTTLHMIGSHWFYDSRYTENFKKFTPTATSKFVKSSTKEEIINSYDNTILYLDCFLHSLITKVNSKEKASIIIYLSDHGEILGEDNKWFHAQNHEASQNPAMLVWYSNEFKNQFPKMIENLHQNKSKKITTDFLFHTVMDLFKIENFKYNTNESIFNKR